MNRKELLEEAGRTIAGQRQDDYGDMAGYAALAAEMVSEEAASDG